MKYFIDFEATQFSNEIISIGCVREDGEEFYSLVNSTKSLTPFITDLTGITNEMIAAAPTPEEVFSDFFNWCAQDSDIPTFYCYGNTDVTFVKKNFQNSKDFTAKCILGYLYAGLQDYAPVVKNHFGLIQPVSLIKVVNYYNTEEMSQCHDALEDALMLKFVYEQIQIHTQVEDQDAFPEYKQVPPKQPAPEDNWDDYIVYRIKKNQIVQTFHGLESAAEWIRERLPDNGSREQAQKKNLINKIKHASNTDKKYIKYKWKVKKVK